MQVCACHMSANLRVLVGNIIIHRSFEQLGPLYDDLKGPVYFNWTTGEKVYENKGQPSFYVDMWAYRTDSLGREYGTHGQDGAPDQNTGKTIYITKSTYTSTQKPAFVLCRKVGHTHLHARAHTDAHAHTVLFGI